MPNGFHLGQLELQRGAPTWWKCTWLLNLLGIRFTESVKDREHYEMLKRLVQDVLLILSVTS